MVNAKQHALHTTINHANAQKVQYIVLFTCRYRFTTNVRSRGGLPSTHKNNAWRIITEAWTTLFANSIQRTLRYSQYEIIERLGGNVQQENSWNAYLPLECCINFSFARLHLENTVKLFLSTEIVLLIDVIFSEIQCPWLWLWSQWRSPGCVRRKYCQFFQI